MSKNFKARRAKVIVLQVILRNVCVLILFQCLFLDQISFETNQKTKFKVDFNFIFILIEKYILEIS